MHFSSDVFGVDKQQQQQQHHQQKQYHHNPNKDALPFLYGPVTQLEKKRDDSFLTTPSLTTIKTNPFMCFDVLASSVAQTNSLLASLQMEPPRQTTVGSSHLFCTKEEEGKPCKKKYFKQEATSEIISSEIRRGDDESDVGKWKNSFFAVNEQGLWQDGHLISRTDRHPALLHYKEDIIMTVSRDHLIWMTFDRYNQLEIKRFHSSDGFGRVGSNNLLDWGFGRTRPPKCHILAQKMMQFNTGLPVFDLTPNDLLLRTGSEFWLFDMQDTSQGEFHLTRRLDWSLFWQDAGLPDPTTVHTVLMSSQQRTKFFFYGEHSLYLCDLEADGDGVYTELWNTVEEPLSYDNASLSFRHLATEDHLILATSECAYEIDLNKLSGSNNKLIRLLEGRNRLTRPITEESALQFGSFQKMLQVTMDETFVLECTFGFHIVDLRMPAMTLSSETSVNNNRLIVMRTNILNRTLGQFRVLWGHPETNKKDTQLVSYDMRMLDRPSQLNISFDSESDKIQQIQDIAYFHD